ncbi:hypothetical protein Tco_0181204 [Tanacetum coccineum]
MLVAWELKDRTEICYKDKKNNVTKGTKFVNVEYAWKPPMCAECKVFGHEVGKCKAQKGFVWEKSFRPKEKVKELEKENMHKKKKSNVYAKSKYFDTKGFMRSRKRGHANLLCIVPILSDVPEGTIVEFA